MQLTTNFKLKEFIESRFYDSDSQKKVWEEFNNNKEELLPKIQKLANQLQIIRNAIGKPININIAYRPLFWELKQNRSGTSKHTQGIAADIVVKGITTKTLHKIIEDLISKGDVLQGGLGYYDAFIHYDYRGKKARWKG